MMNTLPLLAAMTLTSLPHARLELSSGWLDFGQVEIGDTASDSVELRNVGATPVSIKDVDFFGDDAFQVDGGDCEKTLEPGESCDIEIEFNPGEIGSFSGELEVETAIGDLEMQVSGEATRD